MWLRLVLSALGLALPKVIAWRRANIKNKRGSEHPPDSTQEDVANELDQLPLKELVVMYNDEKLMNIDPVFKAELSDAISRRARKYDDKN